MTDRRFWLLLIMCLVMFVGAVVVFVWAGKNA